MWVSVTEVVCNLTLAASSLHRKRVTYAPTYWRWVYYLHFVEPRQLCAVLVLHFLATSWWFMTQISLFPHNIVLAFCMVGNVQSSRTWVWLFFFISCYSQIIFVISNLRCSKTLCIVVRFYGFLWQITISSLHVWHFQNVLFSVFFIHDIWVMVLMQWWRIIYFTIVVVRECIVDNFYSVGCSFNAQSTPFYIYSWIITKCAVKWNSSFQL